MARPPVNELVPLPHPGRLPGGSTASDGAAAGAASAGLVTEGLTSQFGCKFAEARRVRLAEQRRDLLLSLAASLTGTELEGLTQGGHHRDAAGRYVGDPGRHGKGGVVLMVLRGWRALRGASVGSERLPLRIEGVDEARKLL